LLTWSRLDPSHCIEFRAGLTSISKEKVISASNVMDITINRNRECCWAFEPSNTLS